MLRQLPFYLIFITTSLLLSSAVVVGRLFKKNSGVGNWAGYNWSRLTLWAARVKIRKELDTINPDDTVILMVNHQSFLDIPILFTTFADHRKIGFVAKKSLFSIPIFGAAMREAGHIPIDRSNRRSAMKSIDIACESAERGYTVVIFPEGTRNHDRENLGEFKIGGIIMALKTKLPIAPVIIHGSREVLPKGRFLFKPGKKNVTIKALPQIPTGSYSLKEREQFKNDLYKLMNSAYKEMQA